MTDDTAHALHLEVDFAAPMGRVWTALTSSYGLRAWWWADWDDVRVTVDARVGGTYRFEAHAAAIVLEGRYLEVDRGAGRLVFTWEWSDSGERATPERCEITLVSLGHGSRLGQAPGSGVAVRDPSSVV